jgi:hypothetical protein
MAEQMPRPPATKKTPRPASLYEDHWWCCGCGRGGEIYDLASLLEGGPWGSELRREAFRAARELVAARLADRSTRGRQLLRR